MSLPAPEQVFMLQEATLPFLKDLLAIKAAQSFIKAGNQEKEVDMTTITNGEDNGTALKIP